jgi:hypothetical protein
MGTKFNEKNAHPWYEGMGSWLGHGHLHARRPIEEAFGESRLLNKPNEWWVCPNVDQ